MFGKVFGIERVHLLKKSDSLIEVLEKIILIPENKLVYIEESGYKEGFTVLNILTLKDLLNYICPLAHEEI